MQTSRHQDQIFPTVIVFVVIEVMHLQLSSLHIRPVIWQKEISNNSMTGDRHLAHFACRPSFPVAPSFGHLVNSVTVDILRLFEQSQLVPIHADQSAVITPVVRPTGVLDKDLPLLQPDAGLLDLSFRQHMRHDVF